MKFDEPVSHESFMSRALYDSASGYYSTRAIVGKSGDFSTSATLSQSFAEAISNWAVETASSLGLTNAFPIIELGPGDGSLSKKLAELHPKCPLYLVETSQQLRDAQARQLSNFAFQHKEDLASALQSTEGVGLIIANEFMDAFPAVKLRWHGEDWHEVGVAYEGGEPRESLAPLVREIDADAPAHPREGDTIYVHPSFHKWLRSNAVPLKQGAILFIDYGADRPSRDCRAYSKQERFEGLDVYKRPGFRDITTDVNFTDLRRWLGDLQFTCSATNTQAAFLEENLPDFEARKHEDNALAFLTNPLGAGSAFKVMTAKRSRPKC